MDLPNGHEYQIRVFTGDESGAGTDSAVFISLHGKKGNSEDLELKKSEKNLNKFERNNIDVFRFTLPDLGTLKKMRIWLKSGKDDWLLDKVLIDCPTLGQKYIFPCGRWFSSKKEDRLLERELVPKA